MTKRYVDVLVSCSKLIIIHNRVDKHTHRIIESTTSTTSTTSTNEPTNPGFDGKIEPEPEAAPGEAEMPEDFADARRRPVGKGKI